MSERRWQIGRDFPDSQLLPRQPAFALQVPPPKKKKDLGWMANPSPDPSPQVMLVLGGHGGREGAGELEEAADGDSACMPPLYPPFLHDLNIKWFKY